MRASDGGGEGEGGGRGEGGESRDEILRTSSEMANGVTGMAMSVKATTLIPPLCKRKYFSRWITRTTYYDNIIMMYHTALYNILPSCSPEIVWPRRDRGGQIFHEFISS